jgi:hypothetical protein
MSLSTFSSGLPTKIHHIFAINHSFIITFSKRNVVWFFHFRNDQPCLYEVAYDIKQLTYLKEKHPLDHFLSDALLKEVTIQGDGLILTFDTKGHGPSRLTILFKPYKPRYHLENKTSMLHQSHEEKLSFQPSHLFPLHHDASAFEIALATELLSPFKKIVTQQLKLKSNKMRQYELDELKVIQAQNYQNVVDTLMMDQRVDKDKLLSLYGPLLDYEHLSFGELINTCFKKIKKAKSARLEIHNQRVINQVELEKLATWQTWIENPSFAHYEKLKEALVRDHYFVQSAQKMVEVKSHSPHQIQYKTWVISFGKNQKQNDYLTFQLAKKNHIFLHLDGYPSHHLILHVQTFDLEAIRFASELLLFLNNKEDGAIVYAKVGSLKQTHVVGQVLIRDRKTMFVKQSHAYDFAKLLDNAVRI